MHLYNATKLSASLDLNKGPNKAVKSVKLHANMKHETLTHPTQNNDATQKGKFSCCLSFSTLYHRRACSNKQCLELYNVFGLNCILNKDIAKQQTFAPKILSHLRQLTNLLNYSRVFVSARRYLCICLICIANVVQWCSLWVSISHPQRTSSN